MTDIAPFNIYNPTFQSLAGFRSQQLAITVNAAPVAIDESHRVAAHGAFRRGALVDDREFG